MYETLHNDQKHTMKYDIIIFDWDGTIVNSIDSISTCIKKAAQTCGLPVLEKSEAQQIIGLGLYEAMNTLYPDASQADVLKMKDAYRAHWLNLADEPLERYPNADEVLHDLRQTHTLAVATGKSRVGLDHIFNDTGLGELFATSRCADETQSKPHPQMLEEILTETGTSASRALMIGDTTFDMQMARNINMDRIAISYGAHSIKQLAECEPLAIIDNLNELYRYLK